MTLPQGKPENDTDNDLYTNPAAQRETHEIHVSEIRSFLACRRRWNWSSRQGFVPQTMPKPLELGIAFHKGMEAFFDPERWLKTNPKEKTEYAINVFTNECTRQQNKYLSLTNQLELMEADGDDYAERIDLGIGMLTYYGEQVHPKYDNWFKPVMVEVPFRIPIIIPNSGGEALRCWSGNGECGQRHESGAVVTFDGRIDAILEDIVNGGYYLYDHKSAKNIRKDDRILQIDPQVAGYTWAAWELGFDMRGFLYAEYRKDYPRAPRMLSRSYKGRIFSTDKDQATDLTNFIHTVRSHHSQGLDDGVYDDYLAHLRSKEAPRFHERFPVVKSKKQLRNVGQTLYEYAKDMVDSNLSTYPTVGNFSCGGCAYYVPCSALFTGEDHMHSLTTSFQKVK